MFSNLSTNTLFTGKNLVYLPKCPSTNTVAMQMAALPGTTEGTLVVTSEQTAGRGQRGSTWQSQPGTNITASFIFKPVFLPVDNQFSLSMAMALAVKDCVQSFAPNSKVQVKWPNDIYLDGSKVAGMLIENTLQRGHIDTAVVGIGLNVNQQDFGSVTTATSLYKTTGNHLDLRLVLEVLCQNLEAYYLKIKAGINLNEMYLNHLYRYGVWAGYKPANADVFTGKIVGVSPRGLLRVEVNDAVQEFDIKELTFI